MVDIISFPLDVFLFQEGVQSVLSMFTQIPGYNNDKLVPEVMLGFMLKTNFPEPESNWVFCFGLDEFLATTIHFQLADFSKLRNFRYQLYLPNMFL